MYHHYENQRKDLYMNILNNVSIKSNSQIKINMVGLDNPNDIGKVRDKYTEILEAVGIDKELLQAFEKSCGRCRILD